MRGIGFNGWSEFLEFTSKNFAEGRALPLYELILLLVEELCPLAHETQDGFKW